MAKKVLVIEDESSIREMLCFVLEQQGYQTIEAADYNSGIQFVTEEIPDLILLDWMLPGGSGVNLLKYIKKNENIRNIPVVMITARSEESDKIKGLEVGADDYITKPFSPKELVARLNAVMRRIAPTTLNETIEVKGLKLNPISHRITINNQPLDMGPTEFKMLHFFMTHQDRVFSRDQLLNNIWGTNVYVEDRTVDVHIRRLRKAIKEDNHDKLIQTVRGSGYRFSTDI